MGVLTLGQITSQMTAMAGGRLDWLPSEVSFYANIAAGIVARTAAIQHRSLESSYATTITSGVTRMVLPSDYNYGVALSLGSTVPSAATQWRPLSKIDIGLADVAGDRFSANQRPDRYAEYGATYDIIPSPNSSYSLVLRYQRQPETLTSSSATFSLDAQWDWGVVCKGAELLAASRDDFEHEALNRNRYIDYMSTLLPDQDKKWMDPRGATSPTALPRALGAAKL